MLYLKLWNLLSEVESAHEKLLKPYKVQPLGAFILLDLLNEDMQHASKLAHHVGRAATSFTPILDRLEKRGLIERKPDPADRRAVFICLTLKGKRLAVELEPLMKADDKALHDAFGSRLQLARTAQSKVKPYADPNPAR